MWPGGGRTGGSETGAKKLGGGSGAGVRRTGEGPHLQDPLAPWTMHAVCPVCTLLGVGAHSRGTLPMPAPDRPPAFSAPGNQRMTLVQPGATSLKVLFPTLPVHGQLSRAGVG